MNKNAPVCKLGHVGLSTPDLDKSLEFFVELVGLDIVGENDGAVYLRAWGEIDHHSLILREGPTGVDHFGLRASGPEQLALIAADLRAHGTEVTEVAGGTELGQGDGIRFVSPQGHPWEVYWEIERGRQDSALANQPGKAYLRGSSPMHLDHINIACVDVEAGEAFLADRLGFLRREYVQPTNGPVIASWMSVTSQVHDIAIAMDPPPSLKDGRLHHISYIHNDRADVLRAAEIMKDAGVTMDLAPGKHGISQAFFCYVKDPGSGHRVELFAGGYHIFDTDFEPVRWDETNIMTGMVWFGPDFLPGSGGPMDPTTPCLPEGEAGADDAAAQRAQALVEQSLAANSEAGSAA
jgi:catechol 2,3-dioxygenase